MKIKGQIKSEYNGLPIRVAMYHEDLKESINNIYWALKLGAKLAIIIGDSTVNGKNCEEAGFKFEKLIFNPLLGVLL